MRRFFTRREREREMGRRKRMRSEENPKTLIPKEEKEGDEIIGTKEEKGFFACYLLTSLSPRHKGHTYIGFTVNPRRRIRQHNGEIRSGATRTKKARPWEMVLCIHGFPTNVSALQFEWAWQHPMESLAVRRAAAIFKSFSGIANKIKLAYTMLTLPTWQSLNLTVNFFSTKYTKNSSGCPSLPNHMKVQVRPMDELSCYTGGESSFYDNEDDRDDEEEFHEEGSTDGFIEEGLTTLIANNFADDQDRIEVESREQYEWIEESGMRQPWDSPISKEDIKHPSELIESPVKNLASFASSFITEEIDHDMGFIEEGIDLGQAIRNQTQAKVDDDKDQPVVATEKETDKGGIFRLTDVEDGSSFEVSQPTRERSPAKTDDAFSFNAYHEIEVIDVLTPSPDCRISLRSKRRRADIIDLTKSPVFVQL